MRNLIEINKKIAGCPKEISSYDVSIIKIKNSKETWNEVIGEYEIDSFLKSMALQFKYEVDKTDEAMHDEQEIELLKTLETIRAEKLNK